MLNNYMYINSYSGKITSISEFENSYPKLVVEQFKDKSLALHSKVSNYLTKYLKEFSIHQISYFLEDSLEIMVNLSIYVVMGREVHFSTATLKDTLKEEDLREISKNLYQNGSNQSVKELDIENYYIHRFFMTKEVFLSLLINTMIYCYQNKISIPVKFKAIYDGEQIIHQSIDEADFAKLSKIQKAHFVEQKNEYNKDDAIIFLTEIINNASFVSAYSDDFHLNGRWKVSSQYTNKSIQIPIAEMMNNIYVYGDDFMFYSKKRYIWKNNC